MPAGTPLVGEGVGALIIYFYADYTDLDVDNIAKPILDCLEDVVYANDRVIEQLIVRKTGLTGGLTVRNPSPSLANALAGVTRDFVYIRISNPPDHGEVPS